MKALRNRKTKLDHVNESVFLFSRYRIQQPGVKASGVPHAAREKGKAMAREVAKTLQLKLDV